WSYTTVLAHADTMFPPPAASQETNEARWVRLDQLHTLRLHPGFAASWPAVKAELLDPLEDTRDQGNDAPPSGDAGLSGEAPRSSEPPRPAEASDAALSGQPPASETPDERAVLSGDPPSDPETDDDDTAAAGTFGMGDELYERLVALGASTERPVTVAARLPV